VVQVLINNKPINIPSDGLNISPAPSTGTIELKGDVLGISIDEKETMNFKNLDLTALMNRGIAKHDSSDIYSAQSNVSSNSSQAK
jgi:hypothetical protein